MQNAHALDNYISVHHQMRLKGIKINHITLFLEISLEHALH